jgi:hypothetical protein
LDASEDICVVSLKHQIADGAALYVLLVFRNPGIVDQNIETAKLRPGDLESFIDGCI